MSHTDIFTRYFTFLEKLQWLPKNGKFDLKYWYKLFFLYILLHTLGPCWAFYQIYYGLKHEINLQDIAYVALVIQMYVGGGTNLFFLITKHKTLKSAVKTMNNFGKFGEPRDLRQTSQFLWSSFRVSAAILTSGAFFSVYMAHRNIDNCRKNNVGHTKILCGVYVPIRNPLDDEYLWQVVSTNIFQVYMAVTYILPILAISCIEIAMILMIKCKMSHLQEMLEEVNVSKRCAHEWEKFKTCIAYHVEILQSVELFNDCFTQSNCIVMYFFGPPLVALQTYVVFKEATPLRVLNMLGSFIYVLTLCYNCQLVLNGNESLSNVLYNLTWYDMDRSLKNDVQLLIQMTQRGLIFSTGFGTLSHEFFLYGIEGLYTYINMLITLTSK